MSTFCSTWMGKDATRDAASRYCFYRSVGIHTCCSRSVLVWTARLVHCNGYMLSLLEGTHRSITIPTDLYGWCSNWFQPRGFRQRGLANLYYATTHTIRCKGICFLIGASNEVGTEFRYIPLGVRKDFDMFRIAIVLFLSYTVDVSWIQKS